MQYSNLVLIGMPGCGKSTIGVLLAKRLGYGFIDTDLLIQQSSRKTLQDIIAGQGYLALREMEERSLLSISPVQQVIATGGSVVYSEKAMTHLKELGPIVYLQLDLDTLKERVGDYSQRGIASDTNMAFDDIYKERCPLYEKYADQVIDCEGMLPEGVVEKIASVVRQ